MFITLDLTHGGVCLSLESIAIHSPNLLNIEYGIFGNCPSLSGIKMYLWLWPKLFAAMNKCTEFLFIFMQVISNTDEFRNSCRSASSKITKTIMTCDDKFFALMFRNKQP